jgi:hypothetical protein
MSNKEINNPQLQDRFALPGFGLPLNFKPEYVSERGIGPELLFPNAVDVVDLAKGRVS